MEDSTTASPRPTSATSAAHEFNVEAVQLEYTEDGHDKVYRMFTCNPSTISNRIGLVRHWGRRGANGQVRSEMVYKHSDEYYAWIDLQDQKISKGYREVVSVEFDIELHQPLMETPTRDLLEVLVTGLNEAWLADPKAGCADRARVIEIWSHGVDLFIHVPNARAIARLRPAAAMLLEQHSASVVFENASDDAVVLTGRADTAESFLRLFGDVRVAPSREDDTPAALQSALTLMKRGGLYEDFTKAMDAGRRLVV